MDRDGDGFLLNINDWTEELMYQMAKEDDFEITDEIKEYILKAREMFSQSGTVPAMRDFAKEFGMDRKASKLYDIFKSGPMKKIAKYGAFLNLLVAFKTNLNKYLGGGGNRTRVR